MNISHVLIEKLTHSDEIMKNGLKSIAYKLCYANILLITVFLLSFTFSINNYSEGGYILHCVFCISGIICLFITYIINIIMQLYDEISRNTNKIIVECVTNNELNENNEN